MKIKNTLLTLATGAGLILTSCGNSNTSNMTDKDTTKTESTFDVECDNFADLQVLRYEIEGFNDLSATQKELAYYLYEAANAGRDIIYDQKYKHNLTIRKTIEAIFESYKAIRIQMNLNNLKPMPKEFSFQMEFTTITLA